MLQGDYDTFRVLVENSPLAVIEWDSEFRVRSWSSRAVRLFGWKTEEVLGKRHDQWRFFVEEDDGQTMSAHLHKHFEQRQEVEDKSHCVWESRHYTKRGVVVQCRWYTSFVCTATGQLSSALSLVEDCTTQTTAEAGLRRQVDELRCANAELQQFAHILSHDLQEPLRMVMNYLRLLAQRSQGKLAADAEEFISYAIDGAERMHKLIQDLLLYSRIQTPEQGMALTACEEVLTNTLTDLHVSITESEATITRDPLPTVLADRSQLGQLFQNLLSNALKFRSQDPPRVHIAARQEDSQWTFSVRDNGIGIDRQQGERIFQMFQRLHTRQEYPGTGIGLAICRKIIERHGGRIWVESQPGQGSTFYFTLPLSSGAEQQRAED